jgi:hypothetical protein
LVVLEVLKFHFTVEQVEGGDDNNPGTTVSTVGYGGGGGGGETNGLSVDRWK